MPLTGTPAKIEPFSYTYNLERGGQRWRNSSYRIRDIQPAGSAAQFGVDILWCGDSTTTYGNVIESVPHYVKVILQEALNRPGVVGGYGFMPFNTQNSTSNDWTIANGASDNWVQTHNNVGQESTGWFQAKLSTHVGTNDCKISRYFDPTTAAGQFWRAGITDWEYVGLCFTGVAEYAYLDTYDSVNGAGAPSNKVHNTDGGTWGFHWTRQTGFNPTKPRTLQVCNDSADSPYQIWANGVILYNGDYNEGVRMHGLSSVGSDTNLWNDSIAGVPNAQQAQHLQANFAQFCTGANGGARNAKLVIFPLMLNDCGQTTPNITPAQYQANLQALITYVTALPSAPCVCLMSYQPWDYTTSNPTQLALYPLYLKAMYSLADANPTTVFVIDLWKTLCDTPNTYQFVCSGVTTMPSAGDTYSNNGITFTVVGSNAGKTGLSVTGASAPLGSGVLTKVVSAGGDATITFSSVLAPVPNGYANYGLNANGGAVHDSMGGYNDGIHLLDNGNHIRARIVASALLWGMGEGGSGNYVPNMNSVTGVGTAYNLTNALAVVTFGTTSPTFSLPPGTWLVVGSVKFSGATAADDLQAQLYDNTGAAALGGTHDVGAGTTGFVEIAINEIITISATSNVTLRAQNVTAARGTIVAAGTYLRATKLA